MISNFCHSISELNTYQNVFFVFFAIFWGAVFNVQSRWKAFQFPLIGKLDVVYHRVILSIIILNILPVVYFLFVFCILSNLPENLKIWSIVPLSIMPALGVMGFYRLWLGIIEIRPYKYYKYYRNDIPAQYRRVEPVFSYEKEKNNPVVYIGNKETGCSNIFWAFVYIFILGLVPPLLMLLLIK